LTQYYGSKNLNNFVYEAKDYYYPFLFKNVPTGTITTSVAKAMDISQKTGSI
jgi:hypothetical protein